jgi:hypothetical protein
MAAAVAGNAAGEGAVPGYLTREARTEEVRKIDLPVGFAPAGSFSGGKGVRGCMETSGRQADTDFTCHRNACW